MDTMDIPDTQHTPRMQAALKRRYGVRRVRNVRVPMPDGITLAADLFMPKLPATAQRSDRQPSRHTGYTEPVEARFPLLLEYLPYRKNDVAWQGYWGHRYLAERGFAVARLDVRGTGDSEGVALDEYCPQEQLDGVAAIAWFAAQPWCTDNVGMFGTSYGGFNSLHVAMHRPPALKAICPMYFTDRRYTDDCHYKGGAMQMLYDVGTYGLSMVGRNLLPPRPDLVGERWAAIWEEHLQNEPWLLRWIDHQTEDEQWRHGSLCEAYDAIQCATFLIGGWRDGYTNCNLRTFERLTCPKKLLIGPWLHTRPHEGVPGPRINHWREMARFFAYWLEGHDTGMMDEPPIAIYVQCYDPPHADRRWTSGLWRYETEWPLARGRELTLSLGPGALDAELFVRVDQPGTMNQEREPDPLDVGTDTVRYVPSLGATFGLFSAGGPHVLPGDQRMEEAYSAVYTTPPLEALLEILGYPKVILYVDSDVDVVTFVVRLCDVAPDGSSALVTKGVLNATHRESHRDPSLIVPGRVYELEIDLDATSWCFEPRHRIRLSVSNADFPNTWPSPKPATSRVYFGAERPSRLILPVVGPQEQTLPAPAFEPVPLDSSGPPVRPAWQMIRDPLRHLAEVRIEGGGTSHIEEHIVHETQSEATARVDEDDPARASVRGTQMIRYHWPDRTIEMRSRGQIESDATTFHVTLQAEITMDGLSYFRRHWAKSVPRYLL